MIHLKDPRDRLARALLLWKSPVTNIFTKAITIFVFVLGKFPLYRAGARPAALGEIEFHYYQTAMKNVQIMNTGSHIEVSI